MPINKSVRALLAAGGLGAGLILLAPPVLLSAQNDLDAFMQQVVARRDDNWKKLQQYILDEREVAELRGPGNTRMWGQDREYTWFIRDGLLHPEPRQVRRRDDRRRRTPQGGGPVPPARAAARRARGGARGLGHRRSEAGARRQRTTPCPTSMVSFARRGSRSSSRRPTSCGSSSTKAGTRSSGREQFEGRDVLRVEYYPTKLYEGRQGGRDGQGRRGGDSDGKQKRQEAEFRRVMNKVALVTLWIEPASHQIVKYTFDNINFDFLPGQWLVHVDSAKASMTMSQPFPDVWLPRGLEVNVGLTLATGEVSFRSTVSYHDYREATVTSKVGIPGARGGTRQALIVLAPPADAGAAASLGCQPTAQPDGDRGRDPGPRQRADAGRRNPPSRRDRRRRGLHARHRGRGHPPARGRPPLRERGGAEAVRVDRRSHAGAPRRHRRRRTGEDRRVGRAPRPISPRASFAEAAWG